MKRRCYSKTNPHYKRWGARGIKICDEYDIFPFELTDNPKHTEPTDFSLKTIEK